MEKKNFWLTHSSPRPLGEVSEYEGLHRLRLCNRPSYPLVSWSVKQWPQFCSSSHKFFVCGYLCHQPLSIHFCSIWVLRVLFRCNYLYYYFVGLVPVHIKLPFMELGRRLSSESACRISNVHLLLAVFGVLFPNSFKLFSSGLTMGWHVAWRMKDSRFIFFL